MAKLRKFCAYKRLERPYTRTSKYRNKAFIRVRPHSKIVKYNMGDPTKRFERSFDLVAKSDLQIRHNAIESARLSANRHLEKHLGKKGFYFEIRAFPHHILRENPLASGAGADRMSTGMKMSFGKPIGVAAQIRSGTPIFSVSVPTTQIKVAMEALRKSGMKLPCKCAIIETTENAASAPKAAVPREEVEETPAPAEVPEAHVEEDTVSEDVKEETAPVEAGADSLPEKEVVTDIAAEADQAHAEQPKSEESPAEEAGPAEA